MQHRRTLLTLAVCVCGLPACSSSFREHHFFASKDPVTGEAINYYRIEVAGSTQISSSRYLSGYFDPGAVASYFGEVSATKASQTFPPAVNPSPQAASTRGDSNSADDLTTPVRDENLTSIDPAKQGRQLVLLLSSNAEAVADQLGELASSKDLAVTIAAFAASSRSAQAEQAKFAASAASSDAKRMLDLGDSIFASLGPSPTSAQSQAAMLLLVNRLCADLGARQTFNDLATAQQWLLENRDRVEVVP